MIDWFPEIQIGTHLLRMICISIVTLTSHL